MAAGARWTERRDPFRHWVADLIDPVLADEVADEALRHRKANPDVWVRYDNDCERLKSACNIVDDIGPRTAGLFLRLVRQTFVNSLSRLTGVVDLCHDRTLHGAGVHAVEPGGWLSPHVDYALHPRVPDAERRVNLIVFLNGDGGKSGGAFELYDDTGSEVRERVWPVPGRAVLWCPGDVEFHGTARVAGDEPRLTAAMYYLAPARPTATRKRALFVPNRGPR